MSPEGIAPRSGRRVLVVIRHAVLAIAVSMLVLFRASAGQARSPLPARIEPGSPVAFTATAYCDAGKTKSGVQTRSGVAAADPALLPVGSVIHVSSPVEPRYRGIYTVMDTGSAVQGRRIDLFVSSCREARRFGPKRVLVRVLRLGWNPQASISSLGTK